MHGSLAPNSPPPGRFSINLTFKSCRSIERKKRPTGFLHHKGVPCWPISNQSRTRSTMKQPHRIVSIQRCWLLVLFCMSAVESSAIQGHDTCETDAQCLNGGSCLAVSTKGGTAYKQCYCEKGFGGNRCEQYCPLACQHGGVCHQKKHMVKDVLHNSDHDDLHYHDGFVCKCLGYYTGDVCEIPYENCSDGQQCYNGGKCFDSKREDESLSSVCLCREGFTGESCESVYIPPDRPAKETEIAEAPAEQVAPTNIHVECSSEGLSTGCKILQPVKDTSESEVSTSSRLTLPLPLTWIVAGAGVVVSLVLCISLFFLSRRYSSSSYKFQHLVANNTDWSNDTANEESWRRIV